MVADYLLLLQGCKLPFASVVADYFLLFASVVQIILQSASWLQSIVALEFSMQPFLAPDYFYAFCMASTFFLASKGKLQSALVMQFWLDGVSWLKPTFLVHCSAFTSSSQCWNDFRQTSSKIFQMSGVQITFCLQGSWLWSIVALVKSNYALESLMI